MKNKKTNIATPADVYRSLGTGKICAPNKQKSGPRATKTENRGDLRTKGGR